MLTGRKQLQAPELNELGLVRELLSSLVLISVLAGGVYYLVNFV